MVKKYSDELKIKVVKEYLDGYLGIRSLAKKYDIKSKSAVGRWIQLYDRFGEDGLLSKKCKETYSVQFKLDVLQFIETTDSSEMEAALHFGIRHSGTIANWKKEFRKGGVEDLCKTKGRSTVSHNTSKNKKKKQINEPKTTKELERENELLRLEVEYLKKLQAFQMDPEGYLEKHKQHYHSNSKKNSN